MKRFKSARDVVEPKLMGEKRSRIEAVFGDGDGRFADPLDIDLGIALVRIDDIEATPVPELHINLSGTVLMISSDDQPAALARELGRQVQRPLLSHCFDDAITAGSRREFLDLANNPPVIIHHDRFGSAKFSRQFQRKGPSGNREYLRASVDSQLHQESTQKANSDDRDFLPGLDRTPFEDIDGAAQSFAWKRRLSEGLRKWNDIF